MRFNDAECTATRSGTTMCVNKMLLRALATDLLFMACTFACSKRYAKCFALDEGDTRKEWKGDCLGNVPASLKRRRDGFSYRPSATLCDICKDRKPAWSVKNIDCSSGKDERRLAATMILYTSHVILAMQRTWRIACWKDAKPV